MISPDSLTHNRTKQNRLTVLFFALLAVFFAVAFIWWTIIPYFQVKAYIKAKISGHLSQIFRSNFIFSPYNYGQIMIRNNLILYLNRIRIAPALEPLYNKAIDKMDEVIRREGFDPYDYVFLARAYAKKAEITGDPSFFQKAEDLFKKAVEFSPERQELFYAYGTFLLDRKRDSEARAVMKHALDLGPQATLSHFYYGLAQMTAGEESFAESLDELEFFFEHDPEGPPDPGWVTGAYKTFLSYFYEKRDAPRVLKVAKRLAELDKTQNASFNKIVETINATGQLPIINFER